MVHELEFSLFDKLLKLLAVTLLVAEDPVAVAHGRDEVAADSERSVAVVHSRAGDVTLEEDATGGHDVESVFQIVVEGIISEPALACLLVRLRLLQHVDELGAGVDAEQREVQSFLGELHAE